MIDKEHLITADASTLVDMIELMLQDLTLTEALLYCRWDKSFGEEPRHARSQLVDIIRKETTSIDEWNEAITALNDIVMA